MREDRTLLDPVLNGKNHGEASNDQATIAPFPDFSDVRNLGYGKCGFPQLWYLLVNQQFPIENGHIYSDMFHKERQYSIAMLVYQRVKPIKSHKIPLNHHQTTIFLWFAPYVSPHHMQMLCPILMFDPVEKPLEDTRLAFAPSIRHLISWKPASFTWSNYEVLVFAMVRNHGKTIGKLRLNVILWDLHGFTLW